MVYPKLLQCNSTELNEVAGVRSKYSGIIINKRLLLTFFKLNLCHSWPFKTIKFFRVCQDGGIKKEEVTWSRPQGCQVLNLNTGGSHRVTIRQTGAVQFALSWI